MCFACLFLFCGLVGEVGQVSGLPALVGLCVWLWFVWVGWVCVSCRLCLVWVGLSDRWWLVLFVRFAGGWLVGLVGVDGRGCPRSGGSAVVCPGLCCRRCLAGLAGVLGGPGLGRVP